MCKNDIYTYVYEFMYIENECIYMKCYLYLNSKYWFTVYVCNLSKVSSICVYTSQLHIHLKGFGGSNMPFQDCA